MYQALIQPFIYGLENIILINFYLNIMYIYNFLRVPLLLLLIHYSDQLFGDFHEEWHDGVFANIARICCRDESDNLNWIVMDGTVGKNY